MIHLLWLLAASPTVSTGGTAPPPSVLVAQDVEAEFTTLADEFESAQQEYYDKLRKLYATIDFEKATEAERAEFDKKYAELEETDPAPSFRDKFMELAQRAHGTETAAKAWIEVLKMSRGGMQSLPQSPTSKAIDALLRDHIESKELVQLGFSVGPDALGSERFESVMNTLRTKSPHREVQASALRALADSKAGYNATAEQYAAARPLWVELKEKYGELKTPYPPPYDKSYGQLADGTLFEIDNLQIGCTAPDFDAVDETGAKFKLSDYKGKVVVVDFWGYW